MYRHISAEKIPSCVYLDQICSLYDWKIKVETRGRSIAATTAGRDISDISFYYPPDMIKTASVQILLNFNSDKSYDNFKLLYESSALPGMGSFYDHVIDFADWVFTKWGNGQRVGAYSPSAYELLYLEHSGFR